MNIDLHIERLVLDGVAVPRQDLAQVRTALAAELTRLLQAEPAAWATAGATAGAVPALQAPTVQVGADATPAQWGIHIAQAVYGAGPR